MKRCPRCDAELPDEALFCMTCGLRQDEPVAGATTFDQQNQRVGTQANVQGNYYDYRTVVSGPAGETTETCDPEDALACYLAHVIETNRRLPLQGIRSASGLVSIPLEEIYVTLTATVRKSVKEETAWLAALAELAPGEARRRALERPTETVQQVKVQVQAALSMHPRLVVLGDPGSGKTTLLRYLALTYARDLSPLRLPPSGEGEEAAATAEAVSLVKERLALDEQRLPVFLPLRAFARYLEKECPDVGADGPKLLLDYLRTYFAHQDVVLPPRFFADRLQAGDCVVLLDGVDEVAAMRVRQRAARIIERFTVAYPDNRYVVTSRIVGYTAGARLGADYAVTTVRDFTNDDIARFVRHWSLAVETALAGGEVTPYVERIAEQQGQALLDAIRANPRVRELAVNPLLLTVIALVQRYRAQLPERRVELYEEAVEVLLVQWDAVRDLAAASELPGVPLDAGDRRSMLEPVALWLMEQRVREIELDDLRALLARSFETMVHGRRAVEKAVDRFVHVIHARSGLLVERGLGVYAFSHLTFQEHLAARAVADREDYVAYTLARVGDSWWREVALLEAGYLSTQGKRRATELIRAIMNHPEEPEPHHNLVLAAEALRDVGPARTEGDLAGDIQRRLRRAFEAPLRKSNDLKAQVQRRAAAAEALGRIEGGVFGAQPAFWTLPYGVPVWVEVPAGEFWMGGDGEYDGKPVHRLSLDRYWISRVLVTNAQYRFFVEVTEGRAPNHWEDCSIPRGLENHPVVNVSWYEAMAYAAWLDKQMQSPGVQLYTWQPDGLSTFDFRPETYSVSLPSETEWEKAARGDRDKRAYPWGDDWREGYCNTNELGLNETSPVGVFPEGASPYGVLEMAGNVWEWTRSRYGVWDSKKGEYSLVYRYPYDAGDDRENLDGGDAIRRVLRGGAFSDNRSVARCAFRHGYLSLSHFFYWNIGFRVVVSPSAAKRPYSGL